jgi:hypothetical protein
MNPVMPGFTAEAALFKLADRYRKRPIGAIPTEDKIFPSSTCCAPCGKDLCCDECPPDPGPGDTRRFHVYQFRMVM